MGEHDKQQSATKSLFPTLPEYRLFGANSFFGLDHFGEIIEVRATTIRVPQIDARTSLADDQMSTMISFLLKIPGMNGGLYNATTKFDFGAMPFLKSQALSSSVF